MTEIVLCVVIFLLLLRNFSMEKNYLNHLKRLEEKLAGLSRETEVETPNQIEENTFRDIADVNPAEVFKQ